MTTVACITALRRSRSIRYEGKKLVIPASAIVDILEERAAPALSRWRVEVWGKEPNDYTLVYEIVAKSEKDAAQEGLQRFNDDLESMKNEGWGS